MRFPPKPRDPGSDRARPGTRRRGGERPGETPPRPRLLRASSLRRPDPPPKPEILSQEGMRSSGAAGDARGRDWPGCSQPIGPAAPGASTHPRPRRSGRPPASVSLPAYPQRSEELSPGPTASWFLAGAAEPQSLDQKTLPQAGTAK